MSPTPLALKCTEGVIDERVSTGRPCQRGGSHPPGWRLPAVSVKTGGSRSGKVVEEVIYDYLGICERKPLAYVLPGLDNWANTHGLR